MAPRCWSHEQEIFTQDALAGCENIFASSSNNVNCDCEILNLFKQQSELTTQLGHQPKDMVEGAPQYTITYLDGALGWESNRRRTIRDDVLPNFYPEAWELSPKDIEPIFNDFYFDKTVDSLNRMVLQASTEQLDVVSIPLNDGCPIESKADLDILITILTGPPISMWFEQRNRGLK